MTRDTDYKTVVGSGVDTALLENAVNAELASGEGWEPIGDVFFSGVNFAQGMIKVRPYGKVLSVKYIEGNDGTINAQRANGFSLHNIFTIPNGSFTNFHTIRVFHKYRSTPKGC